MTFWDLFLSVLNKEMFLPYLIGIMICGGLIREYELLRPIFLALVGLFKSKRIVIVLTSLFGGAMPIEGRVVMSAPLLDSTSSINPKSRAKFGIVDYLSTHHYYWWSPLEKTVALPLAAFGLSYAKFMSYTIVPLIIVVLFGIGYILFNLKDDDIDLVRRPQETISWNKLWRATIPLGLTFVFLFLIGTPDYPWQYLVWFTVLTFYYAFMTKSGWRDLLKYVKWEFVGLAAIVLAASAIVGKYQSQIIGWIPQEAKQPPWGVLFVSVIGFWGAFIFGSSSKYVGIAVILTKIFGISYLTWFLIVEYCGYMISPIHKCLLIGQQYFGTPFKKYYAVLGILIVILLFYGLLTILR